MNLQQQRKARAYQAKHRGSARCLKTEVENLQLLLAWESEGLTEGLAAKALDTDRVTLRKMREDAIAEGMRLAEKLIPQPETER